MNLTQIKFTQNEFCRSTDPLPVTGVRQLLDSNTKEPIGSIVTVVVPGRSFMSLNVKVPGSTVYADYTPGASITASFANMLVFAYAMPVADSKNLRCGWSATASAVALNPSEDYV